MNVTYENNRLTVFSDPCDCDRIENFRLPILTIRSAERSGKKTQKLVFTSAIEGEVLLCNNFEHELMAVSDDVPVGRFGDFLAHVHLCKSGEFFAVKLAPGITYTVTSLA